MAGAGGMDDMDGEEGSLFFEKKKTYFFISFVLKETLFQEKKKVMMKKCQNLKNLVKILHLNKYQFKLIFLYYFFIF